MAESSSICKLSSLLLLARLLQATLNSLYAAKHVTLGIASSATHLARNCLLLRVHVEQPQLQMAIQRQVGDALDASAA